MRVAICSLEHEKSHFQVIVNCSPPNAQFFISDFDASPGDIKKFESDNEEVTGS